MFGSALEKLEGELAVDAIVTVRGRVDQKEEGRTTVVAQSVEPFRPDAEEVARAPGRRARAQRGPKPLHVRVGDGARFADADRGPATRAGDVPGPLGGRDRALRRAPRAARRGLPRRAERRACAPSSSTCSAARRGSSRLSDDAVAGSAGAATARRRPRARLGATQAPSRARPPPRVGPLRSGPGRLEHAREPGEARLVDERARAVDAELALADVGVAVAVGAERRLRVVEVQRADAAGADRAPRSRRSPREGAAACGSRSPRRAGGRSRGRRRGAAPPPPASSSAASSVERAARACRRRRRCSRGAAGSARTRRAPAAKTSPARAIAGADRARLRRARVDDDGVRADRVADAQRVGQRGERLGADLRVLRGAVEEVDGMDQDGADLARRHRLAEAREVLLAVVGRAPGARRLVEDLDRARRRARCRARSPR